MNPARTLTLVLAVPAFALALSIAACDKKPETSSKSAAKGGGADHGHSHKTGEPRAKADGDGHDHKDGDGHDHADDHGHGPRTELGTQAAAGLTVAAAREGDVTPGGEASFDITVTGGEGKPAAVRVWVGTQDGKGSVKGKAEVAGDGWHAHAEGPKPLPAGSKLWVEIESVKGEKHVVGFDLKS